jgi:hypothetical protein
VAERAVPRGKVDASRAVAALERVIKVNEARGSHTRAEPQGYSPRPLPSYAPARAPAAVYQQREQKAPAPKKGGYVVQEFEPTDLPVRMPIPDPSATIPQVAVSAVGRDGGGRLRTKGKGFVVEEIPPSGGKSDEAP